MRNEIKNFLEENNLTEEAFEEILKEVYRLNNEIHQIIVMTSPLGWKEVSVKLLKRILDIYNNSVIDFKTGEIKEINYE